MNFEELNLAAAIVKAVLEQGYETPTAIQAQAIPAVLDGHDLLGGAQTGTGKTAAFVLPMLHKLSAEAAPKNKFGGVGIRALVLTPTRELAAQVEESVQTYGKYLKLTSTVVFGGVGMNPQISRVKKGVDILVATPGRLLDLLQQGVLDLGQVQILVLDEADRMLDMGFIHDVKKVLAVVPRDKQSLLFSATFSDEIRELAATLLKDPLSIQVTPRNTTVQRITQLIHPVGRGKKKALLAHIINEHNWSQVLVFTRTKFGANNVAEYLVKNGIQALALHGNKSQAARTQALAGFKSGDVIGKVNGQPIVTSGDLPSLIGSAAPGEKVNLEIWRQGKREEIAATLGNAGDKREKVAKADDGANRGKLGLALRALQPQEKRATGVARGLLIEDVGGPAATAGVQPGDVLLAVNGLPIDTVEQVRAIVARANKSVALLIERDGSQIFVPVRVG